jgi:hypothetical protein
MPPNTSSSPRFSYFALGHGTGLIPGQDPVRLLGFTRTHQTPRKGRNLVEMQVHGHNDGSPSARFTKQDAEDENSI